MKWNLLSHVDSLRPHGLYSPWNSPGQNTRVGSSSLLQDIFPTQGSNPGLLHCGRILYGLSHQGSPRTLEWVAYPFSRGSSLSRNWTGVSCTAGRFFTSWATREAGRGRLLLIMIGISLKFLKQVLCNKWQASLTKKRLLLTSKECGGTSLVVQWLRLCLPMQGVQVRTLIRELRSHMPCGQKSKT